MGRIRLLDRPPSLTVRPRGVYWLFWRALRSWKLIGCILCLGLTIFGLVTRITTTGPGQHDAAAHAHDADVPLDPAFSLVTLEDARRILASTPRPRPLGISLGPSLLTATYFDASDRPVHVAKVEAPESWRAVTRHLSQTRNYRGLCIPAIKESEKHTTFRSCRADAHAFLEAMDLVVTASAARLGQTPVVGHVVTPYNVSAQLLSQLHRETRLHFATEIGGAPAAGAAAGADGDSLSVGFVTHMEAVRTAFNLTYPETLGRARRPGSRHTWTEHNAADLAEFAEDAPQKNYILLVNYEPDYLELTYVCLKAAGHCVHAVDAHHTRPAALPELGATRVDAAAVPDATRPDDDATARLARLASGITDFWERTRFTEDASRLRAVVVAGSAANMTSVLAAVGRAFPFLAPEQIKTLPDPAFVFSLGAAATNRRLQIQQDRRWAHCDDDDDDSAEEERQRNGHPGDGAWPCHLSF